VEACRAWKALAGELPLAITVTMEGEEECGSKHLFDFARAHSRNLHGDI
jgi:acetylornithine deacetylase/succinyl-diaminopimelate desuccinylase-like protein